VTNALRLYGEGLRGTSGGGDDAPLVRFRDGTVLALDLDRYLAPADDIDVRVLDGLTGPVLDVGCGPGRHLHALAARGIFALGVDLSPVAVQLAVGGGGRAMVGDIFGDLPGGGMWRSALLLDGNIGIGGCPVRLLERLWALLADAGVLVVELAPPGTPTGGAQARIETAGVASEWFAWARLAAQDISPIARAGGFVASEPWGVAGRWFARCRRGAPGSGRSRRDATRRMASAYSVP
jgi:SAM-dependent methyltransferase